MCAATAGVLDGHR